MPLKKLAIYYGWPSLVNDANGEVEKAAATFSEFNYVVLGATLEMDGQELKPRHEDHDKAKTIIETAGKVAFFGYVNLGVTNTDKPFNIDEIKARIQLWKGMGVKGIFLDAAGYDFGVTRTRQNEAFKAVHDEQLKVFVNAHMVENVFSDAKIPLNEQKGGNPEGRKPALKEGDLFLFEDFIFSKGSYQDPVYMRKKLNLLNQYKRDFQMESFGMSTFDTMSSAVTGQLNFLYYCADLFDMDGVCITDPNHSSTHNRLYLFIPSFKNVLSPAE